MLSTPYVWDKNGQVFSIEQLSDGEKCTLAMIGDIARRLSIANPNLSDPLQGGGIVLIDEVDLQNGREKAHSVRGGMKAATGNGSGKERE